MAKFTETFTNGLSHQVYQYVSDSNIQYNVESRLGFSKFNGMPNATGIPNLPVHSRARYLHLQSTTLVNGKIIKRRVPCQTSAIITLFKNAQLGQAAGTVQLDGLTFKVMGYTGEHFHKSRG